MLERQMVARLRPESVGNKRGNALQCNLVDVSTIMQTMEKLAFLEQRRVLQKEVAALRQMGKTFVPPSMSKKFLQARLMRHRRMKEPAPRRFVGLLAAE